MKIFISSLVIIVAAFSYSPLSADYSPLAASHNFPSPIFEHANADLWKYLRIGLNYLESPKPLAAPENVQPTYVHPDMRGFGAYGFSPEAYQDVQRLYPYFRQYAWQDIMGSQKLYELANRAFADWLLKNLQGYIPRGAGQEEVFDVLQQAWNLGLSGFKNGRNVVASRAIRAEEFKADQRL